MNLNNIDNSMLIGSPEDESDHPVDPGLARESCEAYEPEGGGCFALFVMGLAICRTIQMVSNPVVSVTVLEGITIRQLILDLLKKEIKKESLK